MANSPQSAKRARQAERRRLRGQSLRSQFRTAAKKTRAAAQTGESETARKNFQAFQTIADRLADRGVVHHNTVSRLKSRINAELKKAQERAAHSAQAVAESVDAGAAKAKAPKAARKAKTAPAGPSAKKDGVKTVKAADKPEKVEAKADAPESESGKDSKPAEAAGGEVKADSPDSPPAKAETDDGEGEKAQKAG